MDSRHARPPIWARLRWALALLAVAAGGCPRQAGKDRPSASQRDGSSIVTRSAKDSGAHAASGPRRAAREGRDPRMELLRLHHALWVSGEVARVRRELRRLLGSEDTRSDLRAEAALQLAQIADLRGSRRRALQYLQRAEQLAPPGSRLAARAEERRARVLSLAPLADVRGPAPGTVRLQGASPEVVQLLRRAERLLVAYHKLGLQPRLETIDAAKAKKIRALRRAVAAYSELLEKGKADARAAALFRIASMYHHLAEALAFRRPPELLPAAARQLRRELRSESSAYLRKALRAYRKAMKVSASGDARQSERLRRWQQLAAREAKTLSVVLERSARGRR